MSKKELLKAWAVIFGALLLISLAIIFYWCCASWLVDSVFHVDNILNIPLKLVGLVILVLIFV